MPVIDEAGDAVNKDQGLALAAHFVIDASSIKACKVSRVFSDGRDGGSYDLTKVTSMIVL
jgi:hypothetical protein